MSHQCELIAVVYKAKHTTVEQQLSVLGILTEKSLMAEWLEQASQ